MANNLMKQRLLNISHVSMISKIHHNPASLGVIPTLRPALTLLSSRIRVSFLGYFTSLHHQSSYSPVAPQHRYWYNSAIAALFCPMHEGMMSALGQAESGISHRGVSSSRRNQPVAFPLLSVYGRSLPCGSARFAVPRQFSLSKRFLPGSLTDR